jgi:chemotaxis response regulator CheB
VIADDDPFARRVIKEALTEAGVMIVAEARNGRQAVEFALYYRPDVVILDLVMRELDGILATRQILKMVPDQP